jgi:hypothetical protein
MINIEFSFICRKKFDELGGDDKVNRFCGNCAREVINLDVFTETEQHEFSNLTAKAGMKVCVSTTVRKKIRSSSCVERYKPIFMGRVGEMRSPHDSTNPFTEEEADNRIRQIFSEARKRLQ